MTHIKGLSTQQGPLINTSLTETQLFLCFYPSPLHWSFSLLFPAVLSSCWALVPYPPLSTGCCDSDFSPASLTECVHTGLRKSAPNQWLPPSPFPWPRPLHKSAISPLPPFPFPHIILPLHLPFQPLYPQPHTLSTRACQVGSELNAPSLPSHLACGFENLSFSSQVHHTEPWNKKASSMTFLSPSLIFMMEEEATLWMCRGHVLVASMFPASMHPRKALSHLTPWPHTEGPGDNSITEQSIFPSSFKNWRFFIKFLNLVFSNYNLNRPQTTLNCIKL